LWACQCIEQESNLILLDKTAHLLDGLRRAVAVVERYEVDFASRDAACSLIMFQKRFQLAITHSRRPGRYTRWCGQS